VDRVAEVHALGELGVEPAPDVVEVDDVARLLTGKVVDMNADPLVEFSTLGAYVMTVPAGAAVLMDNIVSRPPGPAPWGS
jgi:hypothetical protein